MTIEYDFQLLPFSFTYIGHKCSMNQIDNKNTPLFPVTALRCIGTESTDIILSPAPVTLESLHIHVATNLSDFRYLAAYGPVEGQFYDRKFIDF